MPIQTDTSVTPTARDPREFEYGLFITDAPAQGGAAGFSWFASDAEGLAYLAEQLPALYLDTDEIEEITSAITEALQRASELKALDLAPINAALTGLCEVRWAGPSTTWNRAASRSSGKSKLTTGITSSVTSVATPNQIRMISSPILSTTTAEPPLNPAPSQSHSQTGPK